MLRCSLVLPPTIIILRCSLVLPPTTIMLRCGLVLPPIIIILRCSLVLPPTIIMLRCRLVLPPTIIMLRCTLVLPPTFIMLIWMVNNSIIICSLVLPPTLCTRHKVSNISLHCAMASSAYTLLGGIVFFCNKTVKCRILCIVYFECFNLDLNVSRLQCVFLSFCRRSLARSL